MVSASHSTERCLFTCPLNLARVRRKESKLPTRRTFTVTGKMMQAIEKFVDTEIFLPHEIIIQILSWLPANSLVRFKCVSKLWRATIQDRFFVQMHSTHFRQCFLCKKQRSAENREEEIFSAWCIVDGLVLERSNSGSAYRIRNPLTKQVLVLPNPLEQHLHMSIVYSLAAQKYKLFYIYKKEGTQSGGCKFLTLDIDLNWRNVVVPGLQEGTREKMNSILVNGVYFILKEDSRQIVCLEIESERSSVVESIPQNCIISAGSISTISCNNNFAIAKVDHNAVGDWKLDVWVLEDYKKNKWDQSKISIRLPFMTKYFPEATQMRVVHLVGQCLAFFVNHGQHFVVCNTLDTNAKPRIRDSPPEQLILSVIRASIAHLQGMKAEEKHKETSDYQIQNLPMS